MGRYFGREPHVSQQEAEAQAKAALDAALARGRPPAEEWKGLANRMGDINRELATRPPVDLPSPPPRPTQGGGPRRPRVVSDILRPRTAPPPAPAPAEEPASVPKARTAAGPAPAKRAARAAAPAPAPAKKTAKAPAKATAKKATRAAAPAAKAIKKSAKPAPAKRPAAKKRPG